METVAVMVDNLVNTLQTLHDEYSALHADLDNHRGKALGDTDLPDVNRILKEIQEKFAQMHPILNFIAIRNQYVSNITAHYNEFIEIIKKAGASEEKKDLTNG